MIRTPEVLRERLFRGKNLPPNIPFVRSYQQATIKDLILELNRKAQLFEKGVDVNDVVTGVYSEATEIINPEKVAGTPFTFEDTGEFFRSFHLKIFLDGSFTINANDTKEDGSSGAKFTLSELYGPIIGLNEKSTTELSRALLPFIRSEVRSIIFGS